MEIKCGRRIFTVTSKDLILDNGSCYQLITQEFYHNYAYETPIISKTLFRKLFKEGKIKLSKKRYKTGHNSNPYYDLYEFTNDD